MDRPPLYREKRTCAWIDASCEESRERHFHLAASLVVGGENLANRLGLTIEYVVFFSGALRSVLRRNGGGEVMVKLPNAAKVSPPERGGILEIGFDVAECRVFAA